MKANPREAMLACALDSQSDIAEGALWMAQEDFPDCEPTKWLGLLDELASVLEIRLAREAGESSIVALASVLREEINLRGVGGGDPKFHYLHNVLSEGAGVPITCSTIWIAIGKRAGLSVEGVGLPGHFIVRVEGQLADPFAGGETLDEEAARSLVAHAGGKEAISLAPSWLGAASPRSILGRMSRSLRGCYASREQWDLALKAADRCVALLPEEEKERRDRGLLLWKMDQPKLALLDLRHYLEVAPSEAPDRENIYAIVNRLRSFLN